LVFAWILGNKTPQFLYEPTLEETQFIPFLDMTFLPKIGLLQDTAVVPVTPREDVPEQAVPETGGEGDEEGKQQREGKPVYTPRGMTVRQAWVFQSFWGEQKLWLFPPIVPNF